MSKTLFTVNLPGLPMKITLDGIIGWLIVGGIVYYVVYAVRDMSVNDALISAVGGIVIHAVLGIFHQAGHAYAAKQTGYPMVGFKTMWVISSSLYPKDEPELPAETHIKRALGGQYFSFPLMVIAAVMAYLMLPRSDVTGVLVAIFIIDAAAWSIGAILPAPLLETDGTTLMTWWGKRGQA